MTGAQWIGTLGVTYVHELLDLALLEALVELAALGLCESWERVDC